MPASGTTGTDKPDDLAHTQVARGQMRLLARLSCWLALEGMDAEDCRFDHRLNSFALGDAIVPLDQRMKRQRPVAWFMEYQPVDLQESVRTLT